MSEISFKVTFGKQTLSVSLPETASLRSLKDFLQAQTGVPSNLQKLFLKGLLKNDEVLLSSLNLKESSKILLVGSTANDISQTASVRPAFEEEKKIDFSRDGFSADQQKIIDKGLPAGCLPGNIYEELPVPDSLPGVYNHLGVLIRMTFRKDIDEIWLVTNSSTKKIPFASISEVAFIPIIRHPGYGVLTLTLGKANKLNFYFFPQQFARSLKILINPFYIEQNIFEFS